MSRDSLWWSGVFMGWAPMLFMVGLRVMWSSETRTTTAGGILLGCCAIACAAYGIRGWGETADEE